MNLRRAIAWAALFLPLAAQASFLSGDALDSFADVLSWVVILIVPAAAVFLFMFVHVLPEKIAEKQQHPHKQSIKVLCILSLFFGGMLWPFAWLWAYTKPVGYRAIYGSDKHDDYYIEEGEKALQGKLAPDEVEHLRIELAAMEAKGAPSPELRRLKHELDELPEAKMAPRPQPAVVSRPVRVVETVGGTK
jgi:hypothetical protein